MTEEQWNVCTEPAAMLAFLRDTGEADERRLRLFTVACSRRVWQLLTIGSIRRSIFMAERFADGLASKKDLADARSRAIQTLRHAVHQQPFSPRHLLWVGADAADERHPAEAWGRCPVKWPKGEAEGQASLLRDIFANPFRPLCSIAEGVLAWSDGLVVKLAQAAYDHRSLPSGHLDPDRLAVLSDALEEAGCTDASLLAHLREPSAHVRGCWAVDILTGRE